VLTGIIVALSEEISTLTSQKIEKGECLFLNEQTLLTLSGTGAKNAEKACELLIEKGAKRLISWGCAAALADALKPGDLVLPTQLQTEKNVSFSIDNPWLQYTQEHLASLNPFSESLIESSSIISESTAKKTIHTQSKAIALDMESIAIAKTAIRHNYPTLVVRSIADPVSMSLPKSISYAQGTQGDIILTKLLGYLLTHPAELPGLIKLGLHFRAAKQTLKIVAQQLDTITGFNHK
jgi:hopanoid-associated phosphorylase